MSLDNHEKTLFLFTKKKTCAKRKKSEKGMAVRGGMDKRGPLRGGDGEKEGAKIGR